MPDKPTKFAAAAGRRLKLFREALGMGPGDFAREIGVSGSGLNNWEVGRSKPQPEKLLEAKRLYGLTLDWIYAEDPSGLRMEVRSKLLGPQEVVPNQAKARHQRKSHAS